MTKLPISRWALLAAFVVGHVTLKYALGPHEAFRPLPAWNFGQQTELLLDAEAMAALELRSETGGTTSVGAQAATSRLLVVAFSESWCSPCRAELPELQRLQDTYASAGLQVVVVYANSAPPQMQKLRDSLDLSLPFYAATNGTNAIGVRAVPTLVVLDATGKIVHQHEGRDAELSAFVAANLAPGAQGPR